MPPVASQDRVKPLLQQLLTETDESATAALFVQLCRESPALRHWLWEDFAKDAKTRERFAVRLRQADAPKRIAELAADDVGREFELTQLRRRVPNCIFGGRTWHEIEAIVAQLRAGRADLAAFLLALQWRRAGPRAVESAMLLRCAAAFLDEVIRHRHRARLIQLATALDALEAAADPKLRRASVAFGDWWKLHLLAYILRHPQPSYRTRELHAELRAAGLRVDPREIRRFCTRHGIARDVRGGRPALTSNVEPTGATRAGASRNAGRRSNRIRTSPPLIPSSPTLPGASWRAQRSLSPGDTIGAQRR